MKEIKIAITIPTGRPKVKKVVKLFLENAKKYGYSLSQFSVYLSIDTEFKNSKLKDFKLDEDLEKSLNKVEYITSEKRNKLCERLTNDYNINSDLILKLFGGNGYSPQRNSALLFSLMDKNDVAICIDDDEFPILPLKKSDSELEWKELDFFSPHILALTSGTDITRGPYLGYQSPIPSDFEKDVPEHIRKKLGEALAYGSEIITSHSFLNLLNKIKYLSKEELSNPPKPFTVKFGKNGKTILTGNMGINLNSVRKGKIPIFFTPPNARGEDAIFGLQLKNVKVKEVNSYIFHDPFDMYQEIFEGKFPDSLSPVPVTQETTKRFANALIGWLKYAPILIAMTSKDKKSLEKRADEMLKKIKEPTQELARILSCVELLECQDILKKYYIDFEEHFDNLNNSQEIWQNKIIPSLLV